MSASCLPIDAIWMLLHHLPCHQIVQNRVVCRLWKITVDRLTSEDWHDIFSLRVCGTLSVSDDFDWKVAAVRAARIGSCEDTIRAACTWHDVTVRMRAPWVVSNVINAPLWPGILRVHPLNANIVDYIYDNMFRLRGLGRTCSQQLVDGCLNCQNKRQCLFLRYSYYLRPIRDAVETELDECLSEHLSDIIPIK